jgi:pimeloyl-ACP methyl ester carboxylesterase
MSSGATLRRLPAVMLVTAAMLLIAGFGLWTPDLSRATLQARYLEPSDRLVDVLGTEMRIRDTGPEDAPAILMVHGFGSSLETWDGWAGALDRDFRVLRFDLPGSGLSAPDASGDYSDERSIALILELMEQLDIGRASLVGHSLGGRIAWRFAAAAPDRVERLVLVAPDGYASNGFEYGQAPEIPPVFAAMQYVFPEFVLRMNLEPAYGSNSVLKDATVRQYHDMLRAPGSRRALLDRMSQTVLVEPAPLLESIAAPVLLIWGEQDGFIPVDNADDYQRELPEAELLRLQNVGHVPQEERPAETAVRIREFLTSGAGPAG